jgi:hypothetical protein
MNFVTFRLFLESMTYYQEEGQFWTFPVGALDEVISHLTPSLSLSSISISSSFGWRYWTELYQVQLFETLHYITVTVSLQAGKLSEYIQNI